MGKKFIDWWRGRFSTEERAKDSIFFVVYVGMAIMLVLGIKIILIALQD
ncbi:hypothetical protein HSX11_23185 [Oxalobacteraceae bacterium]|nr:hypothetical protein [Oxalobacteraceae bacterium]